jgi:lambda family phage tail tape measure protein
MLQQHLATSGIAAMIDGTKSAEQVFVEFLSSIADALIDTAKQMIAQYIAIGIARIFAGIGAPGGFAPSGPLAAVGNVNTDVSGFFSPSANGNAFGANGIIPFAKGGIVNSPTVFPFAKGIGLMGEAGTEAILPLKRGADGSLGVMASGGGGDVNVVVNVDAKGSSVEGNEQGANQLGRVISAAVQSELIKQQRPGGILAR